jgi:hypothetical protein
MSNNVRRYQIVLVLYVAFVFIQSLFFKFTDSPETRYIFGTLETWAGGLGLPGLFAPGGIASANVVGSTELVASVMLLASILPSLRFIRPYAALIAMGVISGAIFFHLFTPLGVSVLNTDGTRDGGLLFGLACGVWLASAALVWLNRDLITLPGGRRRAAVA